MAEQCTWTVDFYFDARDRSPALEFINTLPKREPAKLYTDLDLVCLTSRNEGTPVALIEAMAAVAELTASSVTR